MPPHNCGIKNKRYKHLSLITEKKMHFVSDHIVITNNIRVCVCVGGGGGEKKKKIKN